MEQHFFELVITRSAERIIGVLLGGLAIFLGYKLFINVPQSTDSSAEVDITAKVKVILTRIGPGVFFALFGAGIVLSSYCYPITTSLHEDLGKIVNQDSTEKGTTYLGQSTMNYNGMAQNVDIESRNYNDRMSEVRLSIATLNSIPDYTPTARKVSVRPALTQAKLAMLFTIWQPKSWGQFHEFMEWINDGEVMPASNSLFKEPYEIFQLSNQ